MKYNLSSIMKKANTYKELSKSARLRKAWAEAKIEALKDRVFCLDMADRLSNSDWDYRNKLTNEIAAHRRIIDSLYFAPISEEERLVLDAEYQRRIGQPLTWDEVQELNQIEELIKKGRRIA